MRWLAGISVIAETDNLVISAYAMITLIRKASTLVPPLPFHVS